MLSIYNSLTNRKEEFVPIEKSRIRIYVCGMTVYDFCHLGHARVMVAFDTIIRYLRYRGFDVIYVRNITDIDDKIIQRANELGESVQSLTDRYIDYMNEDLEALSILKPNFEPRATDFIPQIIEMISDLIKEGYAYPAANGDVYYRTRRFKNYGELSGERLDDLRAGSRIAPDEAKDDVVDFVLWKSSKPNEPKWESPWGDGRPGWHIECSAMSTSLLGNHFDIHGGGMDLLFPHHENEIAQSEAATGEKFVNLWMHNGYLQIKAEKMSKSLKNFLTIREVLGTDSDRERIGEVLRLVFLTSQYRSPLNYSDESLENARMGLRRIYMSLHKAEQLSDENSVEADDQFIGKFQAAMDDDFNTSDALAVIFDCVRELNRAVEAKNVKVATVYRKTLLEIAGSLGLLSLTPVRFLGVESSGSDDGTIQNLIDQRVQARSEREWKRADRIRDELASIGVEIEDRPDGTTTWRKS